MSVNRRLLLGLGLAAGLTVPSAAMAQDSIKIGVLATFEGAFAILGDDSMRGAVMAVDDLGGKVGGKKIEIVKGSSRRLAGQRRACHTQARGTGRREGRGRPVVRR